MKLFTNLPIKACTSEEFITDYVKDKEGLRKLEYENGMYFVVCAGGNAYLYQPENMSPSKSNDEGEKKRVLKPFPV